MEQLPVRNPFPGAASFYLLETTSTMDDAKKLVRLGFPPGSVVAAGSQSAGRGRFPDRVWEAEGEANLLATLILAREAALLPGFPLRMGLALCRAVDLFCLQSGYYPPSPPELKWPNDVLIGDRKLAGILCEATAEATFAGFGVNINQRSFPGALAAKATSLVQALGLGETAPPLDRFRLLELVLDQISLVLAETGWKEEAEALLWKRGERVRFQEGLPESNSIVEGRILGISPEGALLIDVAGEKQPRALSAGELILTEAPRVDRGDYNHIR
jgi:BirA family biotin operon repressor/biotin-[acetyl-CoA-carboxylase] ligase